MNLFLSLSVALLGVGCKGGRREVSAETKQKVAQLAPEATKKLESIAALAPKVKEAPPVGMGKPLEKLPYPAKLAIVGEGWLVDPKHERTEEELDLHDPTLYVCKSILDHPEPADEDVTSLERCIGIEQVAVVRQRNLRMPEINEDAKSFSPGSFDGEVLVFELAKGDLVGTYSFSATNTEKLQLTGEPTGGHWHREAIRDLTKNTHTAAEQLFSAKLPPPPP